MNNSRPSPRIFVFAITMLVALPSPSPAQKLFLLIGNVADEFTQALTAYGLAKKAGLKHVTYLSVFKAEQFLDVPHFAAKFGVEEATEFRIFDARSVIGLPEPPTQGFCPRRPVLQNIGAGPQTVPF